MLNVPFICLSPSLFQYADALAQEIGLTFLHHYPSLSEKYMLVLTEQHLELQSFEQNIKPIYVDFLSFRSSRRSSGTFSKELLARAVGMKKGYRPSVLDATAGFGADAFLLSSYGCQVHCLERSSIVYALLYDGLVRLHAKDTSLKITVSYIDATTYFSENKDISYDVVYLDPMFPETRKKALPKKEMLVLRDILGIDKDSENLLLLAMKYARKRVVVKRPLHARSMLDMKPDLMYKGSSNRFDVYLRGA